MIFEIEIDQPEAKKNAVIEQQVRLRQDAGGGVGSEGGRYGSHEELGDHGGCYKPDQAISGPHNPKGRRGPCSIPENNFANKEQQNVPAKKPEKP